MPVDRCARPVAEGLVEGHEGALGLDRAVAPGECRGLMVRPARIVEGGAHPDREPNQHERDVHVHHVSGDICQPEG